VNQFKFPCIVYVFSGIKILHHQSRTSLKEHEYDKEEFERIRSSMNLRSKSLEKEVLRLQHDLKDSASALEDMQDRLNKVFLSWWRMYVWDFCIFHIIFQEVHEEVGALKATNADLHEKLDRINKENENLKAVYCRLRSRKICKLNDISNIRNWQMNKSERICWS